jgi:hypothetical protein
MENRDGEGFAGRSNGKLIGFVDRFASPRTLSGWVINDERIGDGRDIVVSVRLHGRQIGEGRVEYPRPDLIDAADHMAGFRFICTEDIPNEAIAFGFLSVEARDGSGRSIEIGVHDPLKAIALTQLLLRSAPPVTQITASTILSWLAESPALPEAARQALILCRDTYFDTDPAIASPAVSRDTVATISAERPSKQDQDAWLLCQFENLGHDCALGSVQRNFGAEPLGLLRFAGIGIVSVVRALEDRLSGVGNPEFTRLIVQPDKEYMSFDTRYHMASHTFIFEGAVVYERFYAQHCKRLSYLARNLLEDIEEGKKILLVHALPERISETDLQALHRAVRQLGPATLLSLQPATEALPAGTVVRRDDGILVGCVLLTGADLMKPFKSVCESWLSVCRNAYAMVSGPQFGRITDFDVGNGASNV